ncbi:MAG: EthD family reductase [Parafilimonas sp.]|nr:EthD family reductase [Parafilimonas sp.]
MIKLSVFYPNEEGKKFDKDYYLDVHMPLSIKLQGDAVKHVEVEFGFSGGMPGSQPPYVAVCHFLYDSFETFQQAFMPHAQTLMDDIQNYTDIQTVLQFSEVKMSL